jgi:hypothetical protein
MYVKIFLDMLSQFQQFFSFFWFAEQADKRVPLFLFHVTVEIIFCTCFNFGAPWNHNYTQQFNYLFYEPDGQKTRRISFYF